MSDVTCRGSFALGTACGRCSKCKAQIDEYEVRKTARESLDGTAAFKSQIAALEARNRGLVAAHNAMVMEMGALRSERDALAEQVTGWENVAKTNGAVADQAKARLAEVEAALKLHQDLDAINVAEVARLTTEMQKQSTLMDMGFAEYERRLATAQHALVVWDVAHRTGRNEPLVRAFEVGVEALTAIRALAQEEPTT